ncbi:hypothetical protein E2C01_083269 [Portunus trituberculatus]|uniref:Uncharacterized protein n=1 Tax=Portunus trituberculatus TaxID=210409 RepID=A0A5B7J602_PORTR|nr:hypothetical protein [Portunus trituberculatus]
MASGSYLLLPFYAFTPSHLSIAFHTQCWRGETWRGHGLGRTRGWLGDSSASENNNISQYVM